MIFVGDLWKDRGRCAAAFDPLQGYGAGKTPDEACADLTKWILWVARHRGMDLGFRVTVTHNDQNTVYVTANDSLRLLALVLIEQRMFTGLSLADVSEKIGAKSRNTYAQYEQGKREPSFSQLTRLLAVVAPRFQLAIIPRDAQVIPPEEEVDEETKQWLAEITARQNAMKGRKLKAMRTRRMAKKPAAKRAARRRPKGR
ncbi:MAG TPA: helix-turn-helix transcriptional regulator [Kofleriaceae bacterium]